MRVRRDDEEGRERDGGLEASFARCSFQSEAEQGREGGQSQKYMGLGWDVGGLSPVPCPVLSSFSSPSCMFLSPYGRWIIISIDVVVMVPPKRVQLPRSMEEKLCGLCGRCEGDKVNRRRYFYFAVA